MIRQVAGLCLLKVARSVQNCSPHPGKRPLPDRKIGHRVQVRPGRQSNSPVPRRGLDWTHRRTSIFVFPGVAAHQDASGIKTGNNGARAAIVGKPRPCSVNAILSVCRDPADRCRRVRRIVCMAPLSSASFRRGIDLPISGEVQRRIVTLQLSVGMHPMGW